MMVSTRPLRLTGLKVAVDDMLRLIRLWRLCASDLQLVRFALRHPRRPFWLLPVVILLAAYALDPVNFEVPIVGVVDDFVLVPLVLHFIVLKLLPAEIRASYAADPAAR
jgi:uncharacterized membrane protein YkvA (DUF1232 family)